MEENNYTEALNALHEALVELKAMGRSCEEKVQEINIILEKQGLKEWDAGATVSKDYCEKSHDALTCTVTQSIKDLKKSVQGRFTTMWAVHSLILAGYGALLLLMLKEIF